MNYEVTFEPKAARALTRINGKDRKRIAEKAAKLAEDPRPHGAIQMKGSDAYRIRSGDYRIVYTINDTVRIVNVTNIGHRSEVYRKG